MLRTREAYDNLLDKLDKFGIDQLYDIYIDDAMTELSDKNQKLYENLIKAITCFNNSIEDQILVEINTTEEDV